MLLHNIDCVKYTHFFTIFLFSIFMPAFFFSFFFFNDTATTEIYTLSLHDALPILAPLGTRQGRSNHPHTGGGEPCPVASFDLDRKSTRLNSSHLVISYAVFCLKKKNLVISLSSLRLMQIRHMFMRLRILPLSSCCL